MIRLELSQRIPPLSFVDWKISIGEVLCKTTLYYNQRHSVAGHFIPKPIALFVYSLSALQEKSVQYSVSVTEEHILMAEEFLIQFCFVLKDILFVDTIVKGA